eukprot:TRINITY_DN20650_c0_g1_i1.p1 TRINITY_DN20650_c0_g1~~TRINITY_DN20650_c0_g1_i1.p1  ORF type:complete len:285 (+),score=49.75 TRINITY_DN20650_c0_g1_i1:64-918(+)
MVPRHGRRSATVHLRLLRCLMPSVLVWHMLGVASRTAFLPSAGSIASSAARARTGRTRRSAQAGDRNMALTSREQARMLDEMLVPPELLYEERDDGMILRERYPGARNFMSGLFAIVVPFASLGFLIVGVSSFFGEPIVDWNPVTSQYLWFLRPMDSINWVPQGIFMTFYGFFGFFLLGPPMWYSQWTNLDQGVCEFNKYDRMMYIVKNGELIRELSFDDIDVVKLDWATALFGGDREVKIMTKQNVEVRFQGPLGDPLDKRVLERRAARLSNFLDKDLVVDDQ